MNKIKIIVNSKVARYNTQPLEIQSDMPDACSEKLLLKNGGEGGIRTPDGLAPIPVFETGAFNHSATSPLLSIV